MSESPAEALMPKTIRDVHLDGCSWTRWTHSERRDAIRAKMQTTGIHVMMMLDVLMEALLPKNASYRERHIAVLRGLSGNGVPAAADLMYSIALGLDCSELVDQAHSIVVDAVVRGVIDEDMLERHRESKERGKDSLQEADSQARDRYLKLKLDKDATFAEAAAAAGRDRALLRTSHEQLLGGGRRNRGLGRMWLIDPSARCWGLGWVWRSRVGSIRSAKRAPGHEDLAQLVMLPHCDAFVTDDRRLAATAREVCVLGRTGKPRDRWVRAAPWIGGFDAFASAILGQ